MNSSCSFSLSIPQSTWTERYWNLQCSVTTDSDWWCHEICKVTDLHFTDQEVNFDDFSKNEKWYYYSTIIFTGVKWWKFHLHVTSTTVEIWKWSVSLEIWMWVLHTICFKNTNGNYFDFKMFLRKFGALGQSFIMIPWNMLEL